MYESDIIIDLYTYNCALNALAKNNRWRECLYILSEIEAMGLKPNSDTIKAVTNACIAAGKQTEAKEIAQRYDFAGCRPRTPEKLT